MHKVFQDLTSKYAEEHRSYHNLAHIDRLLRLHSDCVAIDDEIVMAIWFHDAIYDPKAKHNERLSADFFLSEFSHYVWDDFSREVERLIMATDPARARRGTNREDLMIDLDRSILGAEPAEYLEYSLAIRKEYDFVADSAFCLGRSKILRYFLSQDIFLTDHFKHLEKQARTNLEQELERLEFGRNGSESDVGFRTLVGAHTN